MTAHTILLPETKIVRRGRGWGVKVRWPRTGPWTRTMLVPRFAWHGPCGNNSARWPDLDGATAWRDLLETVISDVLDRASAA